MTGATAAGRAHRRRLGRVLRAGLTGSDDELERALASSGTSGLLDAARAHRVALLLWARLVDLDTAGADLPAGTGSVLTSLEAEGQTAALRRLRLLADLSRLQAVLSAAEVDVLVVKGPAVAELLYARPELRSYGDLDVVVRPADFALSLDRLDVAGCPVLDRNWTLIRDAMAGEVHVRMPMHSLVDLHWTVLFHRVARQEFGLQVQELFDRREVVDTPVGGVCTTSAEDTLLHLCLHAMSDGGHRLSWLYDVHLRVVRGVDWTQVVAVADRWRLGLVTAGMLARCHDLLGTPVPETVLRALCPSRSWTLLTTAVDRVSPVDRVGTGGSLARMVARATRADAGTSLRRLGQQAVLAPLHPSRWSYTTQAGTPASIDLVRAGGDEDDARRDFLRQVSGSAGAVR